MGRRGRRKRRKKRQSTPVQVAPQVSSLAPAIKPAAMKFGLGGNLMKNLQVNIPQKNPVFYEDWDINNDGDINVEDAQGWVAKGRQDLAKQVSTMIGSRNYPAKSPVPSKNITKKQSVKKIYGIPKTRWMKLKPAARKAQAKRFQRSARAKVQASRRQNRMFRGAARLSGAQPDSREQGRLRRTARRMHFNLERARRKNRIKR